MPNIYSGLDDLIQGDTQAQQYYNSLPELVRDQISQRSDSVNSLASLKDYAENLLRGDS
jgi:hypothetical protein